MASIAQQHAPSLAPFLEHPEAPLAPHALALAAALAPMFPSTARQLEQLADSLATLSLDELQELHGRTFDLSPACTPYLSVHIFGDESFKRAELMAGLAEAYSREAFSSSGEVHDHLGVILRFAPHFTPEEWGEFGQFCFHQSLSAMRGHLRRANNPYLPLMEAIVHLLATDFPELLKEKPCTTSSFLQPFLTLPSSPSSPGACGGCALAPSATQPCLPSS